MRKVIAAALTATLALLLCACGRAAGPVTTPETTTTPEATTAAETTAIPETSITPTTPAATRPLTKTQAAAATQAPATTAATTTATTLARAFGGAETVLGGPGRGIAEDLRKSPHTVYAVDMGGRRFGFQPRAYSPGAGFAVDVYLDNRDGSHTKIDTFTCASPGVDGKLSIVLVTPDSTVTKDERQNLTLVENVYRFELSPPDGRYSVRLLESHAPYALTAYYALDGVRFVKFKS